MYSILFFKRQHTVGYNIWYFLPANSQRGRQGRTIRLLWDTREESKGATRGFGVDEDTALIVATDTDGDSVTGEVLGTAGVFFADVGGAADYEDEFG